MESQQLALFVEIWMPYIPDIVMRNVLTQSIVPKLTKAVDEWTPSQTPMNIWLQPWIALLPDDMNLLMASARSKLKLLFKEWNPLESRFVKYLEPWANVWSKQDWASFIIQLIIPRLTHLLTHEFVINPRNQRIEPLQAAFTWSGLIPEKHYMLMLERCFFHKWLHALFKWLSVSNKPLEFHDQVSKWYTEWKSVFPRDIAEHPSVKRQFTIALNMMNASMRMGDVSDFAGGVYASSSAPSALYTLDSTNRPALQRKKPEKTTTVTFKETVEFFAAKNGLLFQSTATHHPTTGKQIFKFGQVQVYLDNSLVYAQSTKGQFMPVSFDQLIEMNQALSSSRRRK